MLTIMRFSVAIVFENLETGGGPAYIDSDTGLESMSSAEATTKACSVCAEESGKSSAGAGSVSPDTMIGRTEAAAAAAAAAVAAGAQQIDGLTQEVAQLKNDKLHLLQENVVGVICSKERALVLFRWFRATVTNVPRIRAPPHTQKCQSEIKLRREHEQALQGDLAAAGKEIVRLRELLKEFMPPQSQMVVGGGAQQLSMGPM